MKNENYEVTLYFKDDDKVRLVVTVEGNEDDSDEDIFNRATEKATEIEIDLRKIANVMDLNPVYS